MNYALRLFLSLVANGLLLAKSLTISFFVRMKPVVFFLLAVELNICFFLVLYDEVLLVGEVDNDYDYRKDAFS